VKKIPKVLVNIYVALIALIFVFPIYWIVSLAFKTQVDAFSIPPVWFFKVTFTNFQSAFQYTDMWWHFFNSIVITAGSAFFSLVVGFFAAYAIVRFKFNQNVKKNLSFWILSLRMFPPIGVIIPLFLIIKSLRLLDTQVGMVMVYLFFSLPLTIWLLMGYFRELPIQIEEAAMIDGCSRLGILRIIVLPLAAPGIFATMIITSIFSWNELLFALVLTTHNSTVPVALVGFISGLQPNWSHMAAALTVYILPMIGVAIFVQNYFIKGLTAGALRQ